MKTIQQKTTLFFLVLLITNVTYSQKREVKKANKDFDKYAFIDAREIYLKVVEDGYTSAQIYKNLGDTYYWNSDYDNAAEWYVKLITEFPDETEVSYYYRAAQSLKSNGKPEDSEKYMSQYISKGGDPGIVKATATDYSEYIIDLEKVSVNTELSDFGASYYTDKLVYASTSNHVEDEEMAAWNQQPYLDLFVADMDSEGRLSNPQKLSGDVNTEYHESSTAFTKDGNTMYFTRNNYIDGKKGSDKDKTIRLKLYKATKASNNAWTNVIELPFNDDDYSTAHPTLSLDEKRLYFSSDRPGTIGMSDLWYVDILDVDNYGQPVNLGPQINTEARESFPFISDKNNLFFSSDGRGGLGGYDIFKSTLDSNGLPSEISNLGEPANSSYDDFAFIVKEEEHTGFLSSNRDGGNGSLDDEIYRVIENCQVTINGTVFDADSKELIPGAEVVLMDENNSIIDTKIVGEDGAFSFVADCKMKYSIRGSKERYAPYEKVIQTPNATSILEVPVPLKLIDPCALDDLGCRLKLQPIYFDFDRYNIRPDAEIELAKILAAMREYPQLIIHIESHTDSRASFKYNERLSEKRAQSTLNWLVQKGISKDRLTAKGYGEYQLTNKCKDGVQCTEEEHQLNRRSMFIIKN